MSGEAKYTPGPWMVNNNLKSVEGARPHDPQKPWLNDYNFAVAVTVDGDEQLRSANARLIAAAPRMYAMLSDLATCGAIVNSYYTARIKALLAQARGEA